MITAPPSADPQPGAATPLKADERRSALLFSALVAALCIWVLSLPVFPSQDGPGHKFYGAVLGRLMLHGSANSYGDAFRIRLPVPPYAVQDYWIAFASRVMDVDLAEKLFVCLTLAVTAAGVRVCAKRMGGAGAWASLFVVPLLFHWPLAMGFMNYSFGLGLMLLCFGFWLHAETRALPWLFFAPAVVLLTYSHPVPLLMLLLLCAYDLATGLTLRGKALRVPRRVTIQQLAALLFVAGALSYPLLSSNGARSRQSFQQTAFQLHTYVNELMLHGVSPFFRHARLFSWVDLYRLMVWVVLGGAVAFGARGLRFRWRARALTRPDCMLGGAALLFFVIPLMPDVINGATNFFIRMLLMVWVLALFAASQASLQPRTRRALALAAVVFTAVGLLPAELYFRPVARQLAALDHQALPPGRHGLILSLDGPPGPRHIAPDPYLWSSMVPMLHAHDIPVNSAWIDQNYLPVAPGPDPKLLYNIVAPERERDFIDYFDGSIAWLPGPERQRVLLDSDFIFAIRHDPAQVDLSSRLGAAAAAFQCEVQPWYLVCTRKPGSSGGL